MAFKTADINSNHFVGLFNPLGRRFLNPSYRMSFNFYPLPNLNHPFMPDRDTKKPIFINWLADSDGGLINFNWNKQLGQAAGKWNALFKSKSSTGGYDFHQLVDGDWVDIAILRNGVRIPLCRGLVDQIRSQKKSVRGATVENWSITGSDHGFIFDRPITWSSIWVQKLGEITKGLMTAEVKGAIGGRPDQVFAILIEAALGAGKTAGQWELPSSLSDLCGGKSRFYDILKLVPLAASKFNKSNGLRGAYYNELQLWNTGEQTLHQALANWCNPLLNEIYYDLLPPQSNLVANGLSNFLIMDPAKFSTPIATPTDLLGAVSSSNSNYPNPYKITSDNKDFGHVGAYIRERPFINTIEGENSLWFDLPTWKIPNWLIDDSDLGRGGHERFNLFELLADIGFGTTLEQPPQAQPVYHKDGLIYHGLRAMQQSTIFLAQFGTGSAAWFSEKKTWLKLLVDWYASSPYLFQGTLVIKALLPEIRVGHRIIIDRGGNPDKNDQYYVEGVNHEFQFPPGKGKTVLTLTHGFQGSNIEYLSKITQAASLFKEVWE